MNKYALKRMFMYRNYMKINTLQFIIISLIKLYVILIILIIYMYANNIRICIHDATHNVVILNVIKNVNENVVFRFLLSSYFAYYLYNTQTRGAHPQSTINTRVCFILPPNFSYF